MNVEQIESQVQAETPAPPFVSFVAVATDEVVPQELADYRKEGDEILRLAQQSEGQVSAPKGGLKPGRSAETARNEAAMRILGERQNEIARRAKVAEAARLSGKPIPAVSASWADQTRDPSRMLGSDGRNLVGEDEIGYIASMDDPENPGKKTNAFYQAALADGARLIKRDDGQPWRSNFGIGVAFPIEVSARRLADANMQRMAFGDLNPESNFNAMASQQGLLVRDVSPDETGFLSADMEDAERGVTGILPSRPGHFSGSFASAADALTDMQDGVIRI